MAHRFMEFQKPYAGTLQYVPRLALSDEAVRGLRQQLQAARLIEQPENPQVVIDWNAVERDANRTPVRQSQVALFRDGGDAEQPAVIFYRHDTDRKANTTQALYHIPPKEVQAELAETWKWWEDPTGQKLETLNRYFDQIAANPTAWHPLRS